jgi:hypothetical protein
MAVPPGNRGGSKRMAFMRKVICRLIPAIVAVILMTFAVRTVRAGPCELPVFDPHNFSHPTKIDNPYFPLIPGTVFLYEPVPNPGKIQKFVEVLHSYDENGRKQITIDHRTIDVIVVHDYEKDNGVLVEDTLDYYAQDDDGNVWYCGKETQVFLPDHSLDTTGSWEAGKDVAELGVIALPGYVMLAKPAPGVCYQQESYPNQAENQARVMRFHAKVTLKNKRKFYANCLKTDESSPIEAGATEQKFYAKGVGLVLKLEHKGKTVRTELISRKPPLP